MCRDLAGLGFFNLASRLVEARLRVVYMTSSRRSRGIDAEDGRVDATCYVEPFYPKIVIFIILCHKGILIF
jgi:hypothetical protein